jgi:hypothetical protein
MTFHQVKNFSIKDDLAKLQSLPGTLECFATCLNREAEDGQYFSSKADSGFNKTERGAERMSLSSALDLHKTLVFTHIHVMIEMEYKKLNFRADRALLERAPIIDGCLIFDKGSLLFWRKYETSDDISGSTEQMEKAGRWKSNSRVVNQRLGSSNLELWVPVEKVVPDGKTHICKIEQMINESVIKLLQAAPKNPTVRAMTLQLLKKPIPESCQSFEEIKDWIEINFTPPFAFGEVKPVENRSFTIPATVRGVISGNARYALDASGEGRVPFTEAYVLERANAMIRSSKGLEALHTIIAIHAEEMAHEYIQMSSEGGDYEYSNHNDRDSEPQGAEVNEAAARQALESFLETFHPELLNNLKSLDRI